jgi:hypothetical protein
MAELGACKELLAWRRELRRLVKAERKHDYEHSTDYRSMIDRHIETMPLTAPVSGVRASDKGVTEGGE